MGRVGAYFRCALGIGIAALVILLMAGGAGAKLNENDSLDYLNRCQTTASLRYQCSRTMFEMVK